MPLCKLCSSFSLDGSGLPSLPDQLWGWRTKWRYIHRFYQMPSVPEPTGFPFHPSLDSLKSSAEDCDLCRLILSAIEKAIEELRNPDKDNIRRGDIDIPTPPTWELWLTRRHDLGDGFCVFTNTKKKGHFCFVAAVGICVKEGDPLASAYAGRPVEKSPTSSNTMDLLKNWVDQCNSHPTCTAELSPLPARVIDVGDKANGYYVKLREIENETGKYISLSHCWGNVDHFTTTKASLASHQVSIDYNKLPKSFQDAIVITRLLGIRYIWIDSICICQDDGEDWERESAKMTSIYMNSYLTIAASAAKDSSIGCFTERRPPKYIGAQHTTKQGISGELQAFLLPMRKEALPDLYIEMADNIGDDDHPLATRAWAVQERALPRRTLHFGRHQMYFECNDGFKGENGLHIPWRYHSIHSIERDRYGRVLTKDNDTPLQLWLSLLWNYGPRGLTEPSDKLPAISGLARLISERLDDEYMAGLWRKSLIEGLLWQGLTVRRAPKYRAPSWSWASVDGIPAVSMDDELKHVAEIIDWKIEIKGKNPFGEVKSGWIKLRAPLVPLILDERVDPEGTGVPYDNNPKVRTEKGNPEGCHSRLDFPFSASTGREDALAEVEGLKGVDIFALILAKGQDEGPEDKDTAYRCLIVASAEGHSDAMRRLGFVNLSEEDLGECSQIDHPDERPIITLV